MKYLKLFEGYNQFESEIAEICDELLSFYSYDGGIDNFFINPDGLVDVDGNVYLAYKNLNKYIPLKFQNVTGDFDVDDNRLISLEGSPNMVGGDFRCNDNLLNDLEGAPHTVGGDFWCENNDIRSFEGLGNIKGDFYCRHNPVCEIWDIISHKSNKWDNEKMEFFNDCSIIHDNGESIAIERLNFFLEEIGLPTVEKVKGYKNIY